MTNHDVLWAAYIPLDGLSLDQVETVDTGTLFDGHFVHYTNVNPDTDAIDSSRLSWEYSYTPWMNTVLTEGAN